MQKFIQLAVCLVLSLSLANCASKKKKTTDEGISILQPDSGTSENGEMLGGVTPEGNVMDTTNVVDPGLSLAISGSDTGNIDGLYTVHFGYDQSNLTEETKSLLAANVDWMRANPDKVMQLEGHCDERGSTEYNLALGDRRARAVKEYLSSLGVDSSKLVVISYGKEKLLSAGDGESDHYKNRRVNFLPISQ